MDSFEIFLLLSSISLANQLSTLESQYDSNIWRQSPAGRQIFNVRFIEQLNKTKMLQEIDTVHFNDDEVRVLTTPDNELVSKTLTPINKYMKKMESLLCLTALIIFHDITYFEVTWFSFAKGIDVKKIDMFVTRMITVFYIGKVFVPNWFWITCIKLKALLADKANGQAATDFFDDSKHLFDVWSYCKLCQRHLYLPNTDKYDVLKFVQNTKSTDVFIQSYADQLYDIFELDVIKEKEELFTLDNFRLYHFKAKHLWFLDSDIKFDWNPAKVVLLNEWDKIRLSVSSWVVYPYDSVGYQESIIRVINLHVLYYTWLHLTIYLLHILRFTHKTHDNKYVINLTDDDKSKFKEHWLQFGQPLNSAIELLHIYNGPLWDLTWLMDPDRDICYTDYKSIYLPINKKLHEELKYFCIEGSDVVKDLFMLNKVFKYTYSMSLENNKNMKSYISKIKYILKPFDFYFLKFYSMGKLNKKRINIF